jgi:uncharacterized protein
VSRDPYVPDDRAANAGVLDHGTQYVARFDADGTGEWLELAHGKSGLDAGAGFPSQAEVCINTRRAADIAGATRMDRPEWIAVHPRTGEAYCTLTNNTNRGKGQSPGPDAANPRVDNSFGHIIRWTERGADPAATRFEWDVFLLCGDPASASEGKRGDIKGDLFGSPDGLWFDGRGVLWIQTDVSTGALHQGDYAGMGNNQMLAADPATREVRRFLTGPRGCEITGAMTTADGRNLFVNLQHPARPRASGATRRPPRRSARGPTDPTGGGRARPPWSSGASTAA